MAHGLEVRVPFLDNELVDFAMRCPAGLKSDLKSQTIRVDENLPGLKVGYVPEDRARGKLILREALEGTLPPQVLSGPKQGFSAPDASWFRGESIEFVRRQFFSREPLLAGVMDLETVRDLVTDHLSGRRNRRLLVWSLLNLEFWLAGNQ